jgi:PKHD-type hydroxylase
MLQLWQFWEKHLNDKTIEDIIELGESFPAVDAGLGLDGDKNHSYRTSEIRWIAINDYRTSYLKELMWYYAKEANRNAFGFDINYMPDIQYTKYEAANNGKYDWHHDVFWTNPTTQHRKISIIIQLSDPSEYEGGDFEIDHQYPQLPAEKIKQKGTVIVIPSFIAHKVTPITSGVRKSAVCWVEGPKFR